MRHFFLILFVTVLLSSCATTPAPNAPRNETMVWDKRAETLAKVDNWKLQGQIAVRSAKNSTSASLQWQQHKANYDILLMGPMGSGTMRLAGGPGHARLVTSQGKTAQAATPEQLIATQVGMRVPVSNLYYWIRGLPVPNIPDQKKFDQYHHLTSLVQQGWRIQYLNYSAVNAIDLPSKIMANNPELNVKIIISRWQL